MPLLKNSTLMNSQDMLALIKRQRQQSRASFLGQAVHEWQWGVHKLESICFEKYKSTTLWEFSRRQFIRNNSCNRFLPPDHYQSVKCPFWNCTKNSCLEKWSIELKLGSHRPTRFPAPFTPRHQWPKGIPQILTPNATRHATAKGSTPDRPHKKLTKAMIFVRKLKKKYGNGWF